jgi:hypothetical protein
MTFDRRIAPLLIRLTGIERNETLLAERAENAAARKDDVGASAKRLAGQFPKLDMRNPRPRLAGDPLRHEQRPLRPVPPLLRRQWKARRRTIAEECLALAKATERATVDATVIEMQRSSLGRRADAARRGRSTQASAAGAAGWLRPLRGFFRRLKHQSPAADVDVRGALTRPARLTEASRGVEQQQMQLQLLALQLLRVKELLDQCEARLIR